VVVIPVYRIFREHLAKCSKIAVASCARLRA
jgi:hypothetical protein